MNFKGKHSEVYVEGNRAIKVFKPEFKYNFWKEVRYLTILQTKGFVPKLFNFNPNDLTIEMEFVDGLMIKDFIKEKEFNEVVEVLRRCLDLCFYLDRMRVQKEEMNHPDKHIIVADRVVFIDFERAYETANPSNVTQFLQFVYKILHKKPSLDLIREYKMEFSLKSYLRLKNATFKVMST